MSKIQNLTNQLKAVFIENLKHIRAYKHIGSINFWYDEYSASMECSSWNSHEVPWGILGGDNITLNHFDVFNSQDQDKIQRAVEAFYIWLKSEYDISELNLRETVDLTVSAFSGEPPTIISTINGSIKLKKYSDLEAEEICMQYLEKALDKLIPSPINKISISGHDDSSMISFFTDLSAKREEPNDYYFSKNLDIGLSLSTLSMYSNEQFLKFCSKIVQQDFFNKCLVNKHFVFLFTCSLNKELIAIYDYNTKKIRELDEENELSLLY